MERKAEKVMTKRVYRGMVDVVGARGQPPVKWGDRVLEYVTKRRERRIRGLQHARKE